jgi:hypothetical protein
MRSLFFAIAISSLVVAAACRQPAPPPPPTPAPAPAAAVPTYVPGLGEIMSLQQMRHTKLWLAGNAGNWPLAEYEAVELGEGFDDVVKFNPTHEGSPVDPKDAIPRIVTQPLAEVRQAIEKKDAKAFADAYDALTAACNNCHQATNFGFNIVQRPATNPYPNQVFTPVVK